MPDAAYDSALWSDFAVAVAGAFAALAGLLVVAVSINVREVLAEPTLVRRFAGALIMLLTPVGIAVVLLIPETSQPVLGAVLVALGAVSGSMLIGFFWPRPTGQQTRFDWVVGTGLPLAVLAGGAVLAGIGVLVSSLGGLYWLPVAVIAALIGGVAQAWVLLIEILR